MVAPRGCILPEVPQPGRSNLDLSIVVIPGVPGKHVPLLSSEHDKLDSGDSGSCRSRIIRFAASHRSPPLGLNPLQMPMKNQQIVLAARPEGLPKESDFQLIQERGPHSGRGPVFW